MDDSRSVFFFDIDNCLYARSKNVLEHMVALIDQYFVTHLELSLADAEKLHTEYYTNYGLAIEGLVRHHKIDVLEYNRQVDDAVPLESILRPDPQLRQLLEDIDKTKVKLWLFTNAYVTHGKRVVRTLGIEDLFEGITYSDYARPPLICKPDPRSYARAMREAGVKESKDCFFVDDSASNCRRAEELGWATAHLVEEGIAEPTEKACRYQIRHLDELRSVFPQFFKSKKPRYRESV